MSLQVVQARSIYAGAKPEPVRPVRPMAIIHRATRESALATLPTATAAKPAKPTAKPTRKLSGPRFRVEAIQETK